jgi:membrane-associated HD superfamily phosphohydrolase
LTQPDFSLLRRNIEQVIRRNLAAGIVDVTPRGTYQLIQILLDDGENASARDVSSVVLGYRIAESLAEEYGRLFQDPALALAATEISRSVLTPNLSYDDAETERRRHRAAAEVPTLREFARNERILDAGVRVSRDDRIILDALSAEQAARELAEDATIGLRLRLGRVLVIVCLFAGFLLLLQPSDRQRFRAANRWLLVCVLFAIFLAASAIPLRHPRWGGSYAVPVVLLGMLATILFGERAGARIVIIGILLLAILPGIGGGVLLAWTVGGIAACRMVRRVRHRNQFYKALIAITVVLGVVTSALSLAEGYGFAGFVSVTLRALGSALASTALTLFLLPLCEAFFGVTTELTLLELGDLNHPLLRRMSLESPGTFHHSQVVGTLAEAASAAIGANSLAVRVGANFHDIGKMLKPRYYAENQYGSNPRPRSR